MSAFVLMLFAALFSLALHRTFVFKPFVLLMIVLSGFLIFLKTPVLMYGFAQSSATNLFLLVIFIALLAFTLSEDKEINITQSLFIGAASVLILRSATLLTFVFSFEAVSIISFAVVGHIRSSIQADGAVKMFISGALATALIVLGLALFTFGGGNFNLSLSNMHFNAFMEVGLWVMLGGIFYKLTIVPMHAWAADSYANIKPSSAALLSGIAKSVVFVAVLKLFEPFFIQTLHVSIFILIVLSVLTMTLGNILAMFQKRVGKMLAYSSIAQAGYMLMVFIAVKSSYAQIGLLYLAIAYVFMQTALYLLLDNIGGGISDITLDDVKGLVKKDRLVSFFFAVQIFSLAGVPLLAGFMGKAIATYAVVDAGYWIVALIALLNSTFSIGYYGWFIKNIYFDHSVKQSRVMSVTTSAKIAQIILLGGTLFFGIFAFVVFHTSFCSL